MCAIKSSKVEDIRNAISMNSNNFTVYRARLLKKGILYVPEYGKLAFSLPRFEEFVLRQDMEII